MINPQELRLGNYLRCNDVEMSAYFIVTKIDKSIITDFIEPIPLTEEILIKCGFEKEIIAKSVYSRFYIIEGNICKYKILLNNNTLEFFAPNENGAIKLEYLHDLQNWYYVNSNKKELTIQL